MGKVSAPLVSQLRDSLRKTNAVGAAETLVPEESSQRTNVLKTPETELFQKISLDRPRSGFATPKPLAESDVVVEELEAGGQPRRGGVRPGAPPLVLIRRLKTPEAKPEDVDQEVDCPFKEFGCEQKDSAHEVKKHIRDDSALHQTQLGDGVRDLKQRTMASIEQYSATFKQIDSAILRMTRIACLYSSQFVWHVDSYAAALQKAKRGVAPVVFSRPFFSHRNGYRLAASFAPFGDGDAIREQNSVFVCILKGEHDDVLPWPFACPLTFTLLDQSPDKANLHHVSVRLTPKTVEANLPFLGRPKSGRNPAFGIQRFVPLSQMKSDGRFVYKDSLFIAVQVDVSAMKEI
ncbi:hypothetical protein QR680_009557 [Steinernema hermaphroditum]|uniref:MATH domain-containing protein n=1 Tax=Steinernema hermaphroditum TaxID=289476 RepID=A0AA39M9N7_9BILA|nr:hypothetical protein QR680_009557 [Steinernema hermaphroditum]